MDGEEIKLEGVLYVPSLRVNILSFGKLDEDGFTSTLGGGFLSIFDKEGKQFARIQKTNGSMYLLKLGVSKFCQISREEDQEVWLWHHCFCHQNFRAIDDMRKGEMVRGLPIINFQIVYAEIVLRVSTIEALSHLHHPSEPQGDLNSYMVIYVVELHYQPLEVEGTIPFLVMILLG